MVSTSERTAGAKAVWIKAIRSLSSPPVFQRVSMFERFAGGDPAAPEDSEEYAGDNGRAKKQHDAADERHSRKECESHGLSLNSSKADWFQGTGKDGAL